MFDNYGSSPRPWGTLAIRDGGRSVNRFIPTPVGNTSASSSNMPAAPVHPHARGEHGPRIFTREIRVGSSPRPWGTPRSDWAASWTARFIPTPVGNTAGDLRTNGHRPVHPHARGEHNEPMLNVQYCDGSSPRPWGTRACAGELPVEARFIPTPVGNTSRESRSSSSRAVHPHARGEHTGTTLRTLSCSGSSPRPWGTLRITGLAVAADRFIPTPVGNTTSCHLRFRAISVHPHARGEHRMPVNLESLDIGSSPRPWGTQNRKQITDGIKRFIPTPVGNTEWLPGCPGAWPVHPHARGEHVFIKKLYSAAAGSSPRPWGTRFSGKRFRVDGRFIPTPVGNTSYGAYSTYSAAVHPHARGEHEIPQKSMIQIRGSSPRPWGTPDTARPIRAECRFIPTPVGNTGTARPAFDRRSVHPHARGEHHVSVDEVADSRGSSPRPWGTRSVDIEQANNGRFIPTPVGNTPELLA